MKGKANTIDDILSPLLQRFQKDNFARKDVNEKPPLRSELFSAEQMAQHAQHLANTHKVSKDTGPELLLKRLAENEDILFEVTNLLHDDVRDKKSITPAGEWLLDNFYLIEEQIRIAKRYLPKGYSKGLPRLSHGPSAGFPRVYDIAIQIISHSDGRVDIQSLSNFITAYQKTTFLTLGELWAIPIMIRLALLENLSRVAARIAVDRTDAALAGEWGTKIIETADENPKDLILVTADMARANPPMVSAFVAELTRKLQWKGLDLTLPLTWIEQHLSETGGNINMMVLTENQKQAADQLSMSNNINSLRFLAKMDWREFVEAMSIVEQTLREDIGGLYSLMDFHTRDTYRHAVEKIAKSSNLSEYEVARAAINLAKKSVSKDVANERKAHVGYYLIDKGVELTEYVAHVSVTSWQSIRNTLDKASPSLYFIFALLITAGLGTALTYKAYSDGVNEKIVILVGILSTFAASYFAMSMVNWWATLIVSPKPLPKLNFTKGIPGQFRTMVAVPSLIADAESISRLLEDLEVRFLANKDPNLLFALLTDFKDSDQQMVSEDDALVMQVKKGIENLNLKYGRLTKDMFFLFHRSREWNEQQKLWMGYERKRGKLAALNRVLRGADEDKFALIVGDRTVYTTVKYVITLDSDTQLPRDAASLLVGLMAHPLNRAVYSERKKRVVEGYGIIQPRIAISLHGARRSRFSRMNENDSGIDPYTRVVSDVYQDVFGEGSFIGKGIYDVDTFENTLHDRFPENRILSHDLLEGSYVRCGFASDVQLYEEYPSKYLIDIARRHRWIRGDWQIANWFLPFVPGGDRRLHKNPINTLSRWKILDNLRRSLVPIALFALVVLAWAALPHAWFWMLTVAAIIVVPPILISLFGLLRKPPEIESTQHFSNAVGVTYKSFLQSLFTLVCLPYEAYISLDAIGRTLWRVYVSRRKLLEWNPSGLLKIRDKSLMGAFGSMAVAPGISLGILLYIINNRSAEIFFLAVPVLIIWALSPVAEWWLGLPLPSRKTKITDSQQLYLRQLARKTWAFFENLVGPADNWLPPDNLQEYPIPVIAHRTSPTNIGLSLLANLTAYDFGYTPATTLIHRTASTFATLEKLERYSGHFYNWYDTQSLQTLNPPFISTVDSGNLAGHLLTLRQGLLSLPAQQILQPTVLDGLQDTIRVLAPLLTDKEAELSEFKKEFEEEKKNLAFTPRSLKTFLDKLSLRYHTIINKLSVEPKSDLHIWIYALSSQFTKLSEELTFFLPWISDAIPVTFENLKIITSVPRLEELASADKEIRSQLEDFRSHASDSEKDWLNDFEFDLELASTRARERIASLQALAVQCYEFADMEYSFLYDSTQHLLSIGYNVDTHHRDGSFYDLLASEARLSSFVAIAQGKVSQENWFALGRRLTTADNIPVLLSWSASMFEYLMPTLVMPSYENTLLDETCKGNVKRQIEYGRQQNIPWGISESCYNLVDASLTYQYKAFGVPGLGFKRGLGLDLVIAPYATVLALMVDPEAACFNLETMREAGFEGKYGFFEAVDYTPSRLPRGQSHVVIQTFMAHHQGMSLLALAYLLLDQPMQKRFEADPQFQTSLLLLQEQVPKTMGQYTASTDMEDITPISSHAQIRVINTPHTPTPEVQFLSNGKYHVMMTNAGGGYSRWKEMAVTRWREDTTCDNWGSFCYIRNLDTNELWSNTYHPTLKEADSYTTVFSQGRVEYRRRDAGIETYTEIIVSPEDDIEIRRIHLTNRSDKKQTLEFTSYAEAVMAPSIADASHPAFSNLFVQTEIISSQHAILCTRRARSKDEKPPYMFHLMKLNHGEPTITSYETDRHKFIGRGHSIVNPKSLSVKEPLTGSHGSVLDPIVSIQHRVVLQKDETIAVDIITGMAETRETSQYLIDKYQDRNMRDRAFELSWTHSQVVLRQINATEEDAELYARLAGAVIYTNPALRANSNILIKNQRGQSALWSYSISGDLPIVLLQVSDSNNITLVKQLIQAQAYWHLKGLATDLVILNEDPSGYRQILQDQIQGLMAAGIGTNTSDKQGRIFVRPVDQVSAEDRILLQAVARVIISDSRGSLIDQMNRRLVAKPPVTLLTPSQTFAPIASKLPASELTFSNGLGGFSSDGKEYIINTRKDHTTPLPWINVVANRNFGSIISESGSSYTWSENAHGFRITPWHNDPVSDGCGEAYYLRDEESGVYWSPMPFPRKSKSPYRSRHGFGYSAFEHVNDGIMSEAVVYVDIEASVKFVVLKVRNLSGRPRKLSATGYTEWVLGSLRPRTSMHVVTELDTVTGSLMSRNAYNTEFPNRVAFFDVEESTYSFTADRAEFVGRNGTLQSPEAMKRTRLSGKWGAGLDPCAALQVPFELEDGSSREVVFRLGAGKDRFEAERTLKQFRGSKAAAQALERVREFWEHTLSSTQIETPDQSLNILTNGWLVYQVLACRLWGRSGFYQSGGAFGFRDQLQDVMALMHAEPQMTRDQILLSASRQFREGDVQHWWHPPVGRGVRTLCSDDFVWLPYVTSRYVACTGDHKILYEVVPFIEGRQLNAHEESYYDLPLVSEMRASLYDHCKRAIQHALQFGKNGLPLIGSGDWNDGMNMVGIHGEGESVWLAFFLYDVLQRFIPIAEHLKDDEFKTVCVKNAALLKKNINKNAWDGNWYRRAYFDDGTPLGSTANKECMIDSIAQSWSVISNAGQPERTELALQSANKYLINREKGLIQLLEPPFDTADMDPGYIKGYVPGVRENGGQYTHAAIWMVMAFAKIGDQQHTWELLNMINPINHGKTAEDVSVYKVEPYVMAADVYGVHPHTGRGGWTWYTGSAGWMYQLILESFLGLQRRGDELWFEPCVPTEWPSFKISYRYQDTVYNIEVIPNGEKIKSTTIDGVEQQIEKIKLVDDKAVHSVIIKCPTFAKNFSTNQNSIEEFHNNENVKKH